MPVEREHPGADVGRGVCVWIPVKEQRLQSGFWWG